MRNARRVTTQDRQSADADSSVTLDESAVLEYLEADLSNDEDSARIRGIGNGVALGALMWILLIGALVSSL